MHLPLSASIQFEAMPTKLAKDESTPVKVAQPSANGKDMRIEPSRIVWFQIATRVIETAKTTIAKMMCRLRSTRSRAVPMMY